MSHSPNLLLRASSDLVAGDGRTVTVQLAEWGEARTVSDDGGATSYREAFDSLETATKMRVKSAHGGDLVGHADATTYSPNPQPTIDMVIAETTAGNDALALIRSGAIDAVSVEFVPSANDYEKEGVLHRVNALIQNVALAFNPAHSAPILAVRETPETPKEPKMTDTAPAADVVTRADLESATDELKREIVTATSSVVVHHEPSPLMAYRTLGELTHALVSGDPDVDTVTLQRVLADNVLTANAGVDRPKFIDQIKQTVDFGRPTITAFGTQVVAQGQGNTIEWPINANDESLLVGVQATEKTDVTSVVWSITNGVATLATYAGASDVSFQLIRRSSPAWLDAYSQAMYRGYAITSDTAAATQVVAAAVDSAAIWPLTGTGPQLRAAFFTASTEVENATNMPATFALVASDVWEAIGGLADLYPEMYGTQNVSGTAAASTLRINVSGLPVIHDRFLAAGSMVLSNNVTADWHEDGPLQVSSLDVLKMGENVGVYGMGVLTPYTPNGIRIIPAVAPA
jgi:phage head maturation protease